MNLPRLLNCPGCCSSSIQPTFPKHSLIVQIHQETDKPVQSHHKCALALPVDFVIFQRSPLPAPATHLLLTSPHNFHTDLRTQTSSLKMPQLVLIFLLRS